MFKSKLSNISVWVLCLSFISTAAFAGGTYTGKFRPLLWGSKLYLELTEATATNKPACATRTYVRLEEDLSPLEGENGKVFDLKYSTILAHWMAGKDIRLVGNGQCTNEGDEIIFLVTSAPSETQ